MKEVIKKALEDLRKGKFVLIHDEDSREDEVDLVIAAEKVEPQHIAYMRREGGGLICMAIDYRIAECLNLPYLKDIFQAASQNYPILKPLSNSKPPYGDSSFSISLNYKDTYTGITDKDRALTVRKLVAIAERALKGEEVKEEFIKSFRIPGHLPLLIASKDLLARRGHTELSIYLAKLANLLPATVICEMLDDETHLSLNSRKAKNYAKEKGLIYLEAKEILRSSL